MMAAIVLQEGPRDPLRASPWLAIGHQHLGGAENAA
jgi:hypothetical protein